ncbi:MAG: 3-deoxy-7-phosphoheptulonate synthase [Mariprofundales bacterium]
MSNTPSPITTYPTDDLRISNMHKVESPNSLFAKLALTDSAAKTTFYARQSIRDILEKRDKRLLVIVGPCSIHDPQSALEYAHKLHAICSSVDDALLLVMRVYFEKPRTVVGWKGLINDPDLNGSFHINKGLRIARKLLLDINNMGMPAATEFLDLISPQYVADLISWGAIGARTTESQTHRELASGLSCPVGFKNGTDGNLRIAIDAMRSAAQPHCFLSVTKDGHSAIFSTNGNGDCHIILRGGNGLPNYQADFVAQTVRDMQKHNAATRIMIDCSHANSHKEHKRQLDVAHSIGEQIQSDNKNIIGVMVESHLQAGRQDIPDNLDDLIYGKSITDSCLDWDDTSLLLHKLANSVRKGRLNKSLKNH